MKELILATSNLGKIQELQRLLAPIHCISQASLGIDCAEETGLSFIENALIKARFASLYAQKPALADDSGLVVPSLNGAPGIYSARFAGVHATDEENIAHLLQQLSNTPVEKRSAYFYCAIAIVTHQADPTPLVATGLLHGRIHTKRLGDKGFGYDPIFYLDEYQCTLAQLPIDIKNQISHRAQALQQLRSMISGIPL